MIKRLILVILTGSLLLTGCQIVPKSKVDFTTRQSLEMKRFTLSKTFILEDIRLVGLGDSLTKGVGDERKKGGFVGRLSTELASFQGIRTVDIENEAKRGKRSDQLLSELQSGEFTESLENADLIVMTIGGNDIMRVIKKDFFELSVITFQKELLQFRKRYSEILFEIRMINPDAPLILLGLYNPFTILTDEENEFDQILINWNQAILASSQSDINACFVPVDDLFNSNDNMVYHTDFFHPNSKGYDQMTNRILESLESCGLNQLTKGEMEF